jgi:hypothetical protein
MYSEAMEEPQKCVECGMIIVQGYIDIKILPTTPKGPTRTVRLHSLGGCLGKFRIKHPYRAAASL